MSDLDGLRHNGGATPPSPEFRAALLERVRTELGDMVASNGVVGIGDEDDGQWAPVSLDVASPRGPRRRREGRWLFVAGTVAAAATLVVLLSVHHEPASESDAPAEGGTATVTVAPTSNTSSSTSTTSTTVAPTPDERIAAAGMLTASELGGGYFAQDDGPSFRLEVGGPGSDDPACAPFLGTVFESAGRPTTVRVQPYQSSGAGMQMYVVVFPDEAGARAMMASVADAAFPSCMAAVVSAAYAASDPDVVQQRSPLVPEAPRPLTPVGDDMVVLAMKGTYVLGGTQYDDEGLLPFVRVGRTVFFLNPNSAANPTSRQGYPDVLLERALAAAVDKLRAAQQG